MDGTPPRSAAKSRPPPDPPQAKGTSPQGAMYGHTSFAQQQKLSGKIKHHPMILIELTLAAGRGCSKGRVREHT